MSHTDNTQRKFDKNLPAWLAFKLWLRDVDPEDTAILYSRPATKRQWRREIEMELGA
jgi:hypothetical protein